MRRPLPRRRKKEYQREKRNVGKDRGPDPVAGLSKRALGGPRKKKVCQMRTR